MSDDLETHMLGILERWWSAKHVEHHGLVTSYDPDRYLAKVAIQPGGEETGWIPIETGHIGSTYGIVVGLQPGKGGFNNQGQGGQAGPMSQNQGDQVIVRFQEGDLESGKIVQRVHSDQDKPPKAETGEIIIYTRFQKSGGGTPDSGDGGQGGTGQQITLKKDGSLSVTDGNGATIKCDGAGNVIIDCKTFTVVASQDAGIKAGGNAEFAAGAILGIDAATKVVVQGGGGVSDGKVTTPGDEPTMPPFEVPPP